MIKGSMKQAEVTIDLNDLTLSANLNVPVEARGLGAPGW
jgi:hypothetical protein